MKQEASSEERMSAFSKGNEKQEAVNVESSEIDSIYTPLEEAKEEIWRRWNDKALKKKVEEFLGGDIPEVFRKSPKIVLSRQIQSPNFETFSFFELAKKINMEIVLFEYQADKFVTKNPDKYFLGRVFFYEGVGRNGGRKLSSFKIFDIDKFDGKVLSDIKTFQGQCVFDFYHRLMRDVFSHLEILDISSFYKRNGGVSEKYYMQYLALFVCFGILFENFSLSDAYRNFTKNVFFPNFEKASKFFHVKPLIVRIVPKEKENDVYWRYYPVEIKDKFMLQ